MQEVVRKEQEQLKLLSIFYYVFGGFTAAFSFFPLFHIIIGILFLAEPGLFANKELDTPIPALLGWLFIVFGTVFILLGLANAICLIYAGRFLVRKKHYLFCLVVACLACISFPFGTTLGIFTIIVINHQSVKEQFK